MPGLADVAGPQQAGAEEAREPVGTARELRAPVLELGLPAGCDAAGDGDRDRFTVPAAAARRVVPDRIVPGRIVLRRIAQPTSASQSRFSRESRMCRRNIEAVDPSNARWS
jgi:hypothetical protein